MALESPVESILILFLLLYHIVFRGQLNIWQWEVGSSALYFSKSYCRMLLPTATLMLFCGFNVIFPLYRLDVKFYLQAGGRFLSRFLS